MKSRIHTYLLSALALAAFSAPASAELKLSSVFGDHMVLQRDMDLKIWGWADPGQEVSVEISDQKVTGRAGDDGRWEVKIAPLATNAEGLTMSVVAGEEKKNFSDILVGEVWVCSGQSNMQWSVSQSYDADIEVLTAKFPKMRLITVPQVGTQEIQNDFKGEWKACSPETVPDFSAVGYYFGKQLLMTLDVPIGLIDNAWGGSAAEAWVKREVLEADPKYASYIEQWEKTEATFNYEAELAKWKAKATQAKAAGKPFNARAPRNVLTGQHRPGNLYAGVLHPIIGYGIRGTIWYQGESNAGRAWNYRDLFPMMISHWREEWGQGDFPFYWVQLADFRNEVSEPVPSSWAELREAQSHSLKLPNTGQAVIYDIGEGRDIHPRNKEDVGKRLARIALNRDYGMEKIHYKNPTFKALDIKGSEAYVDFENVGSAGLYAFDVKEGLGFIIAGEDKVWHNAKATIVDKDTVKVWAEGEDAPVAVRYAWAENPVANLRTRENLPVDPFRTDDWKVSTQPE
ncbi:MAG: sialate O-acetylesterase [Verrucomicrobiales bacterium]|nr:sialate O-acetylesterase [Verrucomicrobiales bacterium]